MCETLQASKSGYYDWVVRVPCARQKANEALVPQIHNAFAASDETYGMPRVRAQLLRDRPARPTPAPGPRPNESPVCG